MCNLRLSSVMPIYGASTLIAQFGLRTRLAFKYGYYYARFSSSYVARRELKLTLNESEKYLRTFFIFYRLRMNEFYFQISCIFDRTFGSLMHAACKYVSMVFMCFYVHDKYNKCIYGMRYNNCFVSRIFKLVIQSIVLHMCSLTCTLCIR